MNSGSYVLEHTPRSASRLLKLISDETRLKILRVLVEQGGEACVKEIAQIVGATPSATSHQLAKLEARGIITSKRKGQTVCYELAKGPGAKQIIKVLNVLL